MILGPDGKEMKKELSKEEIAEKLRKVAPKTEEERKLMVKKVSELVEYHRKNKIIGGLDYHGYDDVFKENADRRSHTDGFTKDKDMRMIAQIPRDMEFIIRDQYGEDWYKDTALIKRLFTEDEFGRMCLTVDPKTI